MSYPSHNPHRVRDDMSRFIVHVSHAAMWQSRLELTFPCSLLIQILDGTMTSFVGRP
ncbi:hypothetical protein ACLOJK_041449 [Asimina triloba]